MRRERCGRSFVPIRSRGTSGRTTLARAGDPVVLRGEIAGVHVEPLCLPRLHKQKDRCKTLTHALLGFA